MNNLRFGITIYLLLFGLHANSQRSYTISGVVKDNKETLPGAAVYLSGYKMATVTNDGGRFTLTNLPPGNYDILVQMIGYQPLSKNIIVSDKSIDVEITLIPSAITLNEVVIKPDPNRAYYMNLFKRYFIGRSPNAALCKVLNLDVLTANDDREKGLVTISANDFLIIENQALGYRIKYLLQAFEYDYRKKIFYYAGHPTFEDLPGGKSKQKKWQKNRAIAYGGSIQHFYKALFENKVAEEGFTINKRLAIKNPNKLPDSLINANIKRLVTGKNGVTNLITYNGGNDSLSYWMRQRKEPATLHLLNRANVSVDTLVHSFSSDLKAMSFQDELYVIYSREQESPAYNESGLKISRPLDVGDKQITVVSMLTDTIQFYSNGAISDPRSVLYSGYWSYENIADLMPLDYIYTSKK